MKNLVSLLLVISGLACTDATMSRPTTQPTALGPGDHVRTLTVDGRSRSYLVHVPPQYDATKATPVVLIFHGAMMSGQMMVKFCGMNKTADSGGFVAVYPNGTGFGSFNAGMSPPVITRIIEVHRPTCTGGCSPTARSGRRLVNPESAFVSSTACPDGFGGDR
ncbi:MAG: hypothetical protein NTV86_09510 [Planctomycetota bacterium]|nr:hypothetical protein [Planctomycetota bacterium]